jgi:hypothetical protein
VSPRGGDSTRCRRGHGRRILIALAAAAAGCREPVAPEAEQPTGAWLYELSASADGRELLVEATLPPTRSALVVGEGGPSFVRDVQIREGAGWRAVAGMPSCGPGCVVRYRFLLGDAGSKANDVDVAQAFGGALVAPASTWALRPADGAALRVRFHWRGPGVFLSGAPPAQDGAEATFESRGTGLEDRPLDDTPLSAFGTWDARTVQLPDQPAMALGIAPALRALSNDQVTDWVRLSAEPLAAYFGHLAAARPLVLVVPGEGDEINGMTLGSGGVSVLLHVGPTVDFEHATGDWVVTHELVHANLPAFGYPHEWFEEGLATYVEPVARVRIGRLPPETMWHDLVQGLPNGLPADGDKGLEETHTWGRTYWGGALFCLRADIAIRRQTQGRRSIDDALRAIAGMGAGGAVRVDLARALATADAATGTSVLEDLYRELAMRPGTVDLAALWRSLGVSLRADGAVAYDDAAPLAWVRKGIGSAAVRSPDWKK